MNKLKPFVSVIIPVYNDAERLQKCLSALKEQTYPQDLYEVIVVDNASDKSIEAIVEQYKQAVTTYEKQPGSYAARNQGISLAKGEIFAFTDSDCIPAKDWLENGVNALQNNPNCGIVGGQVELFYQDPKHLTAVELYENYGAFTQQQNIEQFRFGVTANLFTFKSVFERVGNFNPELKSNGDREWSHRVYNYKYQLVYDEKVIVHHPARFALKEIYQKCLRTVGGQEEVYQKSNNKLVKIDLKLILGFLPPIKYYYRVFSVKNKYSISEKIKIILVFSVLKYAGQIERTRVRMGGMAKR
jgi:glycosyltransferase involved in cell wall biosynthesis